MTDHPTPAEAFRRVDQLTDEIVALESANACLMKRNVELRRRYDDLKASSQEAWRRNVELRSRLDDALAELRWTNGKLDGFDLAFQRAGVEVGR